MQKLVMTVSERVNGVEHRADDVIGRVLDNGRYVFDEPHWDRGLVEPRLRDGRLRVVGVGEVSVRKSTEGAKPQAAGGGGGESNAGAKPQAAGGGGGESSEGVGSQAAGGSGGGADVTVLPAAFPGVEALTGAGITTLERLEAYLAEGLELTAINGIGKATATKILQAIGGGIDG